MQFWKHGRSEYSGCLSLDFAVFFQGSSGWAESNAFVRSTHGVEIHFFFFIYIRIYIYIYGAVISVNGESDAISLSIQPGVVHRLSLIWTVLRVFLMAGVGFRVVLVGLVEAMFLIQKFLYVWTALIKSILMPALHGGTLYSCSILCNAVCTSSLKVAQSSCMLWEPRFAHLAAYVLCKRPWSSTTARHVCSYSSRTWCMGHFEEFVCVCVCVFHKRLCAMYTVVSYVCVCMYVCDAFMGLNERNNSAFLNLFEVQDVQCTSNTIETIFIFVLCEMFPVLSHVMKPDILWRNRLPVNNTDDNNNSEYSEVHTFEGGSLEGCFQMGTTSLMETNSLIVLILCTVTTLCL